MARLLGPDPSTRFAVRFTAARLVEGLAGKTLTVYTDEDLTQLADLAEYDPEAPGTPGAAVAGSRIRVGEDSIVPLFWFPDGVDTLWGKTREGYTFRMVAEVDARVEAKADTSWLPYDVRLSGVVGDGSTDDSAALAAAAAVCSGASKRTLYVPAELNVRINSQVNMQLVRRINCEGTITVAYTGGPGLIVGDSSSQRNSAWYYFKRVTYAGVQTNVALRVVGLKSARFTVDYCDYLQLYAEEAVPTQTSLAYTDFFLGRVLKLELYGAAGVSWINENNFYGGSIDTLIVDAVTYGHNGNKWHNCSVEGSTSTIQILKGSCNRIECRGEGGSKVTFGSGTWSNQVVGTYLSSPGTHSTALVLLSDGGTENIVTSSVDENMSLRELIKVDNQSVFFDGSSEWGATESPVPGLDKLALRSSFGTIVDTGIVPIRGTYALDGGTNYYRNWSLLRISFDSDATLWRPLVFAYTAAGVLIDPTVTPWMLTTGGWSTTSTRYQFGSNIQQAQITIIEPTVAFIRITIASSSTAGTAFGYVRLSGYVPSPQPDTGIEQIRRALRRPLYQAAAPTQGAAKIGQLVSGPSGIFRATARVDTTLSSGAASSAGTVTVTSATGIASGDVIGVLLDSGLTHWTVVNGAPAGNVVTLTVALPGAAASGRAVVTNRWV